MLEHKFKSRLLICATISLALLASCGSSSSSVEDVRNSFVKAGGTCTSLTPETTTTVANKETEEQLPIVSIQSLSCGEDEPTILRYDSPEDAKKSAYFLHALKGGILLSFGTDPVESPLIVSGSSYVMTSIDTYSVTKAQGIADKMGATLILGLDQSSRQKNFDELVKPTENGGLTLTADFCLSHENLSADGKSVAFDTKGEEDSKGDFLGNVYCVLRGLLAPDYIFENLSRTRALDGLLEESWGEFRVNWRYHPNTGLQMTIIHKP